MKYSQARQGRIFIIRLEDGDLVHECIEDLARAKSVSAAMCIILGGADKGSRLVVGPEDGRATPVNPMELVLDNVHEVAGVGTIFPDENDRPVLHMHIAGGRNDTAVAGCVRKGVKTWQILEAVMIELVDTKARRVADTATGFSLLKP